QAHTPLRPGDLSDLVHLDQVAFLDVVVVGQADSAFEALGHLPDVVLEALERVDGAVIYDHAVPQQTSLGIPLDDAFGDVAAGHASRPGNPEDGPHFGRPQDGLVFFGSELAHQELFDLVE